MCWFICIGIQRKTSCVQVVYFWVHVFVHACNWTNRLPTARSLRYNGNPNTIGDPSLGQKHQERNTIFSFPFLPSSLSPLFLFSFSVQLQYLFLSFFHHHIFLLLLASLSLQLPQCATTFTTVVTPIEVDGR